MLRLTLELSGPQVRRTPVVVVATKQKIYRQHGQKQQSIVTYVAQQTVQWNWLECFDGYSDDVPSHTAYQQEGYQDWFDNPQPSVSPAAVKRKWAYFILFS